MTRSILLVLALGLAFGAGGCSIFKSKGSKTELTAAQLGPDTGDTVKTLPKGLIGDTENATHSQQELRGDAPQ